MTVTRRFVLTRGLALTASTTAAISAPALLPSHRPAPADPYLPVVLPDLAPAARQVTRLLQDPFTLGVASGEPSADGFVLWTRLAPEPLHPDGHGGMPARDVEVQWQVADDAGFRNVVRTGTAFAQRDWGHSVHVEPAGLPPGREFFYRFRADGHVSAVGRARTAPAAGSTAGLTFAVTSCSNYEHGWFTAYRHLADAGPDLVLNLGDYLYEGAGGASNVDSGIVREHVGGRTLSLAAYRIRHAQYKSDPDLQAAHAAAPWVVSYDDHEVLNNWAAGTASREGDRGDFPRTRAAAMKAYYEHMPLRRTSRPAGPRMQTYRRLPWGQVASFHVLDTRQYRDDQVCGDGIHPECRERHDPGRTLLGHAQERWLAGGLRASSATWDVLAQQVMFSPNWLEEFPWWGGGVRSGYNMDCWDGYPAVRRRLLASAQAAGADNLVVLTGDWHTHWAAEILSSFADLDSRPVGVELITSSVTSDGDGAPRMKWGLDSLAKQPYFRHFDQRRGFVLVEASRDRLRADFRVVDYVSRKGAPVRSSGAFVVEAGRAKLHRA